MSKANIIILSGPSGSGKGTVISLLPSECKKTVSVTTRQPRVGEIADVDYFFISAEEFLRLRDNGMLAEWNKYGDNYYGTPLSQITDTISEGKTAILDIDVNGAKQIRELYPNTLLFFLMVESANEQVKRLRFRDTNTEEDIRKRLKTTRRELAQIDFYERVFINEDGKSKETADAISACINGCKSNTPTYSREYIDTLIAHYFDGCPEAE